MYLQCYFILKFCGKFFPYLQMVISPLGVSSLLCILVLGRLTLVGRQSKHNYNCNIQGASVYTNLSQLHVSASSS